MASETVKTKLHGRAFYESIGSPKYVLAPMVEQSEFAWRMLTRSFMTPEANKSLLAYTPMLHARMYTDTPKYRENHFQPLKRRRVSSPERSPSPSDEDAQPFLDGNTEFDRPLFVQFCANKPDEFLDAARRVQRHCDAVDLNLGCPQGIARKGNYGAFLQENWDTISALINKLHKELDVPVTAKMRVLETREKTLEYAKMIVAAGASIITVHGRQREQKGHNTGVADWQVLRYLRDNLPPETVMFANGNILQHADIETCLKETGADGVMSAEGNLYDPAIFATPPAVGQEGREYWRGRDGKGGYRMDAVMRRYMDIIHRYVFEQEPPVRKPLFIPTDASEIESNSEAENGTVTSTDKERGLGEHNDMNDNEEGQEGAPKKKQKRQEIKANGNKKPEKASSPNLTAMQAHLFHLLRPLVSKQTHIRDALARARAGDIPAFERILSLVEEAVKQGLLEYEAEIKSEQNADRDTEVEAVVDDGAQPLSAVERCKRPWFICQPYVRPLPHEALEKGALQLSKKEKARLAKEEEQTKEAGLMPEGKVEVEKLGGDGEKDGDAKVEIPKQGMVCG